MADCNYNFSSDKRINSIIQSIAGNDIQYGNDLLNIINSKGFASILSKSDEEVKQSLIDYYNKKIFNPSKSTKLSKRSGLFGFANMIVANDAKEYFASYANKLNYVMLLHNMNTANNVEFIIAKFRKDISEELIKRVDEKYLTDDELTQWNEAKNADETAGNKSIVNRFKFAIVYFNNHRNDLNIPNAERNANYADLVKASRTNDFYVYARNHSKINDLFKDVNVESINLGEENTDEFSDDFDATEELSGTAQWNFGDDIKNSSQLISAVVKQKINGLPRLSSPVPTEVDGKKIYLEDRSNTIGTTQTLDYKEVSAELFDICANTNAGTNIDNFMIELLKLATTKKDFYGLRILYDEAGGSQPNDLAYALFKDFCKPVKDNVEIDIETDGSIKYRQSNVKNNSKRKMYYDLINDIKYTASNSNFTVIPEMINHINSLLDKAVFVGTDNIKPKDVREKETTNIINQAISEVQILYKTIFPSIDIKAIDSFVNKNILQNDRRNAIKQLVNIIYDVKNTDNNKQFLYNIIASAYSNYLSQKQHNAQVYSAYKKELDAYNEIAGQDGGITKRPEVPSMIIDDSYYRSNSMWRIIDDITNLLSPYSKINIELNGRTIDGKNQSDVVYNNWLYNVINATHNKGTLTAILQDKMRSDEYKYSNLLVSGNNHYGLFTYNPATKQYEISNVGTQLLRTFYMNGISNRQNGTNAKYTNMSDSDFFYFGYLAFITSLDDYYALNTGDKTNIPKASYLMRIAADSPKNMILEAPKYSLKQLYGINDNTLTAYVNNELSKLRFGFGNVSVFTDKMNNGKTYNTEIEFAKAILSRINSKEEYEANIKEWVSSTKHGSKIADNYKIGDKVYWSINYKAGGQITKAVFSATISDRNIKGQSTTIKAKDFNFEGFLIPGNTDMTNPPVGDEIVSKLSNEFKEQYTQSVLTNKQYDTNSSIFNQLRNLVFSEIQMALRSKYAMFGENGTTLLLNPKQLYNDAHIKNGKYEENGKLVGNLFKFNRLYDIDLGNGKYFNIGDFEYEGRKLSEWINISSTGGLAQSNIDYTIDGKNINFNLVEKQKEALDAAITEWINLFIANEVEIIYNEFNKTFENLDKTRLTEYMLNYTLMLNNMDDLFEGNSAFYKDAQTFTKRAKEYVAGGTAYGGRDMYNFSSTNEIKDKIIGTDGKQLSYQKSNGQIVPIVTRKSYIGVTIKNIVRPVDTADDIYKELTNKETGISKERADELIENFKGDVKVDDAQSYITIYEAIRRIKLLGEYPKYANLITQLLNGAELTDVDPKLLNSFIQVAKNYYFDHKYDDIFNIHVPRQIKNAEFILIPQFVKGTQLEVVLQFMIDNDIDQLNTQETSKAANANIINIWDENYNLKDLKGKEVLDELNSPGVKSQYSYNFLYRQQEVPQHMKDAKNKAGIQIMKKILDNLNEAGNKLKGASEKFVNNYIANIEEDFENLCNELDIKFDENYNLISRSGNPINFAKFNQLGLEQMQRLGVDSNTFDYFTSVVANDDATVNTVMPEFMNIIGNKLENICMAIFTNNIARQTLPGWHAAQVTSPGFKKLKVNTKEDGTQDEQIVKWAKDLKYHSNGENVIQVMLPRWAANLYGISDEAIINSEISTMIGYRIPTEGKQSVGILKVVGILPDAYGSTIIVPDGWIAQTGSDFDVDSIYGIVYEHYINKKNKSIVKIKRNENTDEDNTWLRYTNYVIRNAESKLKREKQLAFNDEQRADINSRISAMYDATYKKNSDEYNNLLAINAEQESKRYKELPDKIREIVNSILQKKTIPYNERLKLLIETLTKINKSNNRILNEFIDINQQRLQIMKDSKFGLEYAFSNINSKELFNLLRKEDYHKKIKEIAEIAGLKTFNEFKKLNIDRQQSRAARNNAILEAAIEILQHPKNLEEMMGTSHFEDIKTAKRIIDDYVGETKVHRSVYSLKDQIFFRRNSMGGAILKAFSVNRDTINSINNVVKTELAQPILVRYASPTGGLTVNTSKIDNSYIIKDGFVVHKGLGHSKNNRNVVGQLITSYSSQTTAHILDAVKEGAIPNENPYTFGTYKTLLDVGMDHYHAMLWLRQPAISYIVDGYYQTQSVFNRSLANPINIAIREIAKNIVFEDGSYAGEKGQIINNSTAISIIEENILNKLGINLQEQLDDIKIDFNDIIATYNRPPVERGNEYYVRLLKQVYTFKAIRDISNNIEAHGRILTADKYGATENFFKNRKKFYDIYDLYNNGKASKLLVGETTLLEAVIPGSSSIAINNDEGIGRIIEDINEGIRRFMKAGENKRSSYPTLNTFFRNCLVPSYLIASEKFSTEKPVFVNAINNLGFILNNSLDEETYNQFKKYVLTYMYRETAHNLTHDIIVDNEGNIKAIDKATPLDRLYGTNYDIDNEFNCENINNPTEEEYNKFHNLNVANKVQFIKSNITVSDDNIFNYLTTNLHNAYEIANSGLAKQTINFDDEGQNIDQIYRLFNEAMDNNNRLIKDTMIDIIKYAFYVEGFNFGRNNASKCISNKALYSTFEEGGINIIKDIKSGIDIVNEATLYDANLYEDFVRGHSKSKIISSHNIKFINKVSEIANNYIGNDIYMFDLNDKIQYGRAIDLGIIRELSEGYSKTNYIVFSNRGNETLYKCVYKDGDIVYLHPLNLLENYEYGESVNLKNIKHLQPEDYQSLINLHYEDIAAYKTQANNLYNEYLKNKKTSATTQVVGVPNNEYFISEQLENNERGIDGINNFINRINTHFSKPNVSLGYFWIINPILRSNFSKLNTISYQRIQDNNGEEHLYTIKRVQRDISKLKYLEKDSSTEELDKILKDNNITFSDDIYLVEKINERPEEPTRMDSSISFADDRIDISDLGRVNMSMYQSMKIQARRSNDNPAARTLRRLRRQRINLNSVQSIEENRELGIIITADYYEEQANNITRALNKFMGDESINNDSVIQALIDEDENMTFDGPIKTRFVELVLKAITFGDNIQMIYNVSTDDLSKNTKKAIDKIKNSIDKVKNNSIAKDAVIKYMDRFLSRYSTNPDIKAGKFLLSEMIDVDETKLNFIFQDSLEIRDAVVQIFLRLINRKLNEGNIKSKQLVDDIEHKINEIKKEAAGAGEVIDINKLVNKETGTIGTRFIKQFLIDKAKYDEDYSDAVLVYGEYSPQAIRAQQRRNNWYAQNVEQELPDSYYNEINNIMNQICNDDDMLNLYCQYSQISSEIKDIQALTDKTDEQYIQLEKLIQQRNEIVSPHLNIDGQIDDKLADKKDLLSKLLYDRIAVQNKYYKYEGSENFKDKLKSALEIIDKYKDMSIKDRYRIKEYQNAVDWINNNTNYTLGTEFYSKFKESIDALSSEDSEHDSTIKDIMNEHKNIQYKDYKGEIDGRKFTREEVAKIKAAKEEKYKKNGAKLIRNRSDETRIFSKEFYDSMSGGKERANSDYRNQIINDINAILIDALDTNTGKVYLSNLTIEQLRELRPLFEELYNYDKVNNPKATNNRQFFLSHVEIKSDVNTVIKDRQIAESKNDSDYMEAFNAVANLHRDKAGLYQDDTLNTGNDYIYSYPVPKYDYFIDDKKTKAKQWLNENVTYELTEYYYDAAREAKLNDTYEQWYKDNHVYNPYTHKEEPLPIWTNLKTTPQSKYQGEFRPTFINSNTTPKVINNNYEKGGINYKGNNYNNGVKLNRYEEKLLKLMLNTMKSLAINGNARTTYAKRQFPFRRRNDKNTTSFAKGVLNFVGVATSSKDYGGLNDNIGAAFDKDVPNESYQEFYDGRIKEKEPMPKRQEGMSDSTYANIIKEWRERNREIDEANNKIIESLREDNVEEAFLNYINSAANVNTREAIKNDLYMLIAYYDNIKQTYKTGFLGNMIQDRVVNDDDYKLYKINERTKNNTVRHLRILANRILFNQFRQNTRLDKVFSTLQGFTSAKYMMINVQGGISNITTGSSNIAMEYHAGQYFNHKDWENAKFLYMTNAFGYILNAGQDKSNNLYDAIFKLCGVIDYEAINERRITDFTDPNTYIEKLKNFAYSPQSAGEHYMQNTVLLAMLMSNRIFKEGGRYVIKDFNAFRYEAELTAIEKVVSENPAIAGYWKGFNKSIKNDAELLRAYQSRSKNIFEDFLGLLDSNTRNNLADKFAQYKKEAINQAKKDYESGERLINQFELKNGVASLKSDSHITLLDIGDFVGKVRAVNKFIHGTYDRTGAATLESTSPIGSIIMQFHKHLPIGIRKWFSKQSYYNESRQAYQKGIYASLLHFIGGGYGRANTRVKAGNYINNYDKLVAYFKEYIKATLNLAWDMAFNYKIMDETDRANLRRIRGHLIMTGYAIASYIMACLWLEDDDDDKLANLSLYVTDRWLSEINMYNWTFIGEMGKTISNPAAAISSIKDMLKLTSIIGEWMILGDDFVESILTGQYAGESKWLTYLERNIPIWRNIERTINIDRHNRYYKLQDNLGGLVPMEDVIDFIGY